MATNTIIQSSSRSHGGIELEAAERFAGGDRSEPVGRVQRPVSETLRAASGGPPVGRGLELPSDLIDEAVDRARLRAAVELPDGGRLSDEVVDELLAGARTEGEIVGPGGLLAQLTKRLVERAMEIELTDHLGFEPHQEPPGGTGNTRNSGTPKTLATEHGPVPIRTPP